MSATLSDPSRSPDVASAPDLTAPSLRRRMACWLYEGTLMFGVVFLVGVLFTTSYVLSSFTQSGNALDNRYLQQALVFVAFGIYFGWFWAKGQTLAMKTWHIRVVDRHGNALTQGRALWRYVLSWLWLLPPLAVAGLMHLSGQQLSVLLVGWVLIWALLSRFHAQRQFLHDALAGTRLVHFKPVEDISKPRRWWS
ncbi:MAG: RDD family protein [Hydrogenophaga sp.]|uniref:RDD family protein n=1 Tax=Hydrogenophaga sp. TaxID=1904254 RepID=UPI0027327AC4|nr:RDD family protein [Hydrogenophaga sp.]MDP3351890.1 RDD family protein [Hydrogenophaga sp.]